MNIILDKKEEMILLAKNKNRTNDLSFNDLCQLNKYSNLKIQQEINNGLSSTLFLAKNELNQKVAIKIFNKSSSESYLKEKEFFEKFKNFQNVVKVYDYGLIDNRKDPYYGHYYLVMEYAEKGDLVNYIEQQNNNETEAKKIIRQILNGYEEINKCGYIHRDLKPENILIMNDNTLKITDFGFCEKMNSVSSKIVGTDGYMPPEVLMNKNLLPQQIDVFSLGVILFLLVAGQFPFGEPNKEDEFYKYIIEENWEEYWKLVDEQNNFSENLKYLIQGMICHEPNKRFNNEKIKSCKWFYDN